MSDEMILVPRDELLAWAEEWLYENDPGDDTDCVTPFDTYLLKSPVEAQRCTCPSGDGSLRWPCPAHPPPSSPVGVEEIREDDIAKIAWQAGFHLEKEDAEGEPTDDWQWPNSEGENMFPDLVKFSRKIAALAQQPAAVDEAMVERIAALLHEEATDEPWSVAGVEHDGPDRDYYRALARKVIDSAGQQPAAVGEESAVVPRWFMEKLAKDTRDIGMFEMSAAIRRVALGGQQGGES